MNRQREGSPSLLLLVALQVVGDVLVLVLRRLELGRQRRRELVHLGRVTLAAGGGRIDLAGQAQGLLVVGVDRVKVLGGRRVSLGALPQTGMVLGSRLSLWRIASVCSLATALGTATPLAVAVVRTWAWV